MRWVNHYTHPGDTRYHVFVFGERAHADRFEERCVSENIEFERHEEGEEWMFGIAKTHFKQALNANHLVHAEFRSHFIPSRAWRWGLLVFTGSIVLLALLGWLTSTSSNAQVGSGLPWELDVLGRLHVPNQVLGMESTLVQDQGVGDRDPGIGSELGLRIHRRLKEGRRWVVAWSGCVGSISSPFPMPMTRLGFKRLTPVDGVWLPRSGIGRNTVPRMECLVANMCGAWAE